jgi:hypothetical protein
MKYIFLIEKGILIVGGDRMNGFYYHGSESYYGAIGHTIKKISKILDEGLLMRSVANNFDNEKLNHVCLYKKNNKYNYDDMAVYLNTARAGWIDNGFVIVINPELDAVKTKVGEETDLVDEWRYYGNIHNSNFVGVALPFSTIREYLDSESYDEYVEIDKEIAKEYLPILFEKVEKMGLVMLDSDKKNLQMKWTKN